MANQKAVAVAPRAYQKPTVVFGLVSIKVGIGKVDKNDKLKGHYYEKESKRQVNQKYVLLNDKGEIERVVEKEDQLHGYVLDNGDVVFFEDEELDDIETGLKGVLEITRFVDEDEIDPLYPETSYNVWPDGPGHTKAFVALTTAMKEERAAGVGTICLSGSSTRLVVLRHSNRVDWPVLQVCSYDSNFLLEKVEAARSVAANGPQPSKEELEMARMFINGSKGPFLEVAKKVVDKYQRDLKAAAKAKAAGKKVKKGKAIKVPESADLMIALKESVAQLSAQKTVVKKAAAARKPAPRKRSKA